MLQALRIRDFRLLWGGGLVSALGSWLLTIAVPAHILQVTGSLRATGLTVAAEYLPVLVLGPVAGVCADRWDRRRLMLATNLFCAGSVAVMLFGIPPGRYWVLDDRRRRRGRAAGQPPDLLAQLVAHASPSCGPVSCTWPAPTRSTTRSSSGPGS